MLGFVLAPFLIWSIVETIWVGFFFPSVEALKDRSEKGNQIENRWKYVLNLGLLRATGYKWEILFSSLSGIIILDFYWLILGMAEKFLPSFLYVIVLAASGFVLVSLLFSKGYGIMSKPPSSPLRSMSYLWGGFANPFDKGKASEVLEVVNRVNDNLMNSRGKICT